MEPAAPPPPLSDAYKVNLDWAIACAERSLEGMVHGTSAFKTQRGILRGLCEARSLWEAHVGASAKTNP